MLASSEYRHHRRCCFTCEMFVVVVVFEQVATFAGNLRNRAARGDRRRQANPLYLAMLKNRSPIRTLHRCPFYQKRQPLGQANEHPPRKGHLRIRQRCHFNQRVLRRASARRKPHGTPGRCRPGERPSLERQHVYRCGGTVLEAERRYVCPCI